MIYGETNSIIALLNKNDGTLKIEREEVTMDNNDLKDKDKNKKPKRNQTIIVFVIAGLITLLGMSLMSSMYESATTEEL